MSRREPRLYDPATADRLRAERRPALLLVLGLAALTCSGLVALAHYELPLLAWWTGACAADAYAYECPARASTTVLAALATLAILAPLVLLAQRRGPIPPTLTCRGCATSGWVLDIEPSGGRCPRCGHDRFAYRTRHAGAGVAGPRVERFAEDDVAGADLVHRHQATRRSWTRRYP